jgi:multidrug efflux pump subunit AcrA (membrane-fusion protein)
MTETDHERFVELLTLLATTFDAPMGSTRLEGYWRALEDMPLDALELAVDQALRTLRFFPKPAELREPAERHVALEALDRRQLLEAPAHFAREIADAAATAARQAAAEAAAEAAEARRAAEVARREALTPEERAAEDQAAAAAAERLRQEAAEAERRRAQALHDLWAAQDRARQAHRRRTEVTSPNDQTVQRCPKCNSFRIIPNPTGEHWHCARCGTPCVE